MEQPGLDGYDSDAEYNRMAAEYEKTKGIKLPPRHKGSMLKSSLTDKSSGYGFNKADV